MQKDGAGPTLLLQSLTTMLMNGDYSLLIIGENGTIFILYYSMELASIKRVDFTFSNLMHSALVSISGTKDEMFVHIQLINSFLRKIFGVEHIRFRSYKGEIKLSEAKHPFVYQVAQLICTKLKEDLQDANSIALRAV